MGSHLHEENLEIKKSSMDRYPLLFCLGVCGVHACYHSSVLLTLAATDEALFPTQLTEVGLDDETLEASLTLQGD